MSDQGSRDIDASFLDRIAKPTSQQHPQEGRNQEERRRSIQDEDPRAGPEVNGSTWNDRDGGSDGRPFGNPFDDDDQEESYGILTGKDLLEMSDDEVIWEYRELKSRCKGNKGFRKHFKTVCKDVDKMLEKDKEFNQITGILARIGKVIMVLCILFVFLSGMMQGAYSIIDKPDYWTILEYLQFLIVANVTIAWYMVPYGSILIIGAILGFAIRYASGIIGDIRSDRLRYRLIVMLCQDGVTLRDVKRLKSTVKEYGGVEDLLYYFQPEEESQ